MKKFLSLLLVAVMMIGVMAHHAMAEAADGSLLAIQQKGTLILGLDDTFPPMGFRDENTNEIIGYDIDLAGEVASRLGVQLICQPIDWAAKEMELSAGNIDCIWNGMSITDERLESMAMSLPYMNNEIVMVAKDSAGFSSIADMAGKNIAVQSGSFAEEVLETYPQYADFFASVNVLAYDEYLTALMDLQQGGVDGVLIDLVVAEYRIAGLGDSSLVVIDSLENDLYGIGFRKGDVALRDAVNAILLEMQYDGTIDAISTKWFGKNISIIGSAQ